MIRGTTPTLRFGLPFDINLIESGFITFKQNNEIIIDKPIQDCTIEDNALILKLSQTDTLKFIEEKSIEIQLRIKTINGDALASHIIRRYAHRILKDGEI